MGVEVEELRNANLLRERGDLLIQRVENLDEAETCFKKVCPLPIQFFLFTIFWQQSAVPSFHVEAQASAVS